jgi:ketosteroid isomerase-like protein
VKTTEELVHELIDREAIRDLSIRHCDYLNRSDVDGLLNLFTKDGSFIVRDLEHEIVISGRTNLRKMYKKLIAEVHPKPLTHTHMVELHDGSSATGRCYVELRSAKIDFERTGSGCYEDDYVKVGDQWKIACRRLVEGDIGISLRAFMAK